MSNLLDSDSDEGFGLVEIVVSMLILGLLAISFLPLLIQGVKVTAQNRVLATATQVVNDEFEYARSLEVCDLLEAWGADTSSPNPDYEVTRQVEHPGDALADPCTIDYPGVLRVTVVVEDAGDDTELVSATTLVLVRSEN